MSCKNEEAGSFTDEEAKALTEPTAPIGALPMRYVWHSGPWLKIFDAHVDLITSEVVRAKAEDKMVIYLSCPISSRGGSFFGTNVDIARHVERSLLERWGEAFWILNPAQYQMESKAGAGLIDEHARKLNIDLARLKGLSKPIGGDYMRMWTKVLAKNGTKVGRRSLKNESLRDTGQYFDAFYFIGPRDVQGFFLNEGTTLTAGIQAYFARKLATDPDFRAAFETPVPDDAWTLSRNDFLRYYGLRASTNFSAGSHDEWLIYKHLNAMRRAATADPTNFAIDGDVGEQIAGFFDGVQIDPASSELGVSRGYSL